AYHGNNGGDGFVIARYLAEREKTEVTVAFLGDEKKFSPEAEDNFRKLPDSVRILRKTSELANALKNEKYSIIIDALLGTGGKRALKGPLKEAVAMMNRHRKNRRNCIIAAVDVPTGTDPDTGKTGKTHVQADLVITFHDSKPGLEVIAKRKPKPRIITAPIGIPKAVEHIAGPGDLKACLKRRDRESKKGDFGKVLLIGGSKEFAGAPILAVMGLSAMRAGTDLVKVAAPEKVAWAINSFTPELITVKLEGDTISKEHFDKLLQESRWADVLLIGPGLGRKKETEETIRKLVLHKDVRKKPKVIDADALKMITLDEVENSVLTPHRGEFAVLWKKSTGREWKGKLTPARIKTIMKHAGSNVLLLKGPEDYIISREKWKKNMTGNPGMTAGGTGDVLAGLAAGLLGLGNGLFESACAAAWLAGKAGDECFKEMGYGFLASDVAKKAALIASQLTPK
ncbi:NAD(P)H-hydrate dehydratase, partial [Candidatus Woesearchaeota archaeon]